MGRGLLKRDPPVPLLLLPARQHKGGHPAGRPHFLEMNGSTVEEASSWTTEWEPCIFFHIFISTCYLCCFKIPRLNFSKPAAPFKSATRFHFPPPACFCLFFLNFFLIFSPNMLPSERGRLCFRLLPSSPTPSGLHSPLWRTSMFCAKPFIENIALDGCCHTNVGLIMTFSFSTVFSLSSPSCSV